MHIYVIHEILYLNDQNYGAWVKDSAPRMRSIWLHSKNELNFRKTSTLMYIWKKQLNTWL